MLRRAAGCAVLLAKKVDNSALFSGKGGPNKLATDEKFGQAALEYIFEPNGVDAPKTNAEVEEERLTALALDRMYALGDAELDRRLERQTQRANAVMAALPGDLRIEASILNSEQPPLAFRRPSLTPPLEGYEPGFGLDVASMHAQVKQYPDDAEVDAEIADGDKQYPLVDPEVMDEFNEGAIKHLEALHDAARGRVANAGPSSEAWEASLALEKRAARRQRLIFRLAEDPDMQERYDTDDAFRTHVQAEYGLLPLQEEPALGEAPEGAMPEPLPPLHYAQQPKSLARKA